MNFQKKYFFKLIAFFSIVCLILNSLNRLYTRKETSLNREKPAVVDDLFRIDEKNDIIFKSECECKKDTDIIVKKHDNNISINIVKNKKLFKSYRITSKEFEESVLTCHHYSEFKRGRNQKIIGYALYGKGHLFYYNFVNLVKTVKRLLPDWSLRVYYDDTIDLDIKCKIECLENQDSKDLIDNVDFCNINKLPVRNSLNETWSGSFMHAMMWRWLPLGDSFVDVFSSRDLDSHLIQREVDAMNDWFLSNKSGHIMRGT